MQNDIIVCITDSSMIKYNNTYIVLFVYTYYMVGVHENKKLYSRRCNLFLLEISSRIILRFYISKCTMVKK